MSNENKRPWYRDPAWLAIIAIIAAAIITSPIWVEIIIPPPSDFNLSINPMQGAVQQGGVITTAITIKGIHVYEQPVSLSATGQPSGVVITFVPPFGEAKPSYTSSVTINVNQNVPAGDYTIIIKGTGADGKEHTCSYTLTIKPSVIPTVTPSLIQTPTMTPTPTKSTVSPTHGSSTVTISITDINDAYKELIVHGKVSLEEDQHTLIFAKGYPEDEDAKGYYVGSLPASVSKEGDFTSTMTMGEVPPIIHVIGIVVDSTSLKMVEPYTAYTYEYIKGIAVARTDILSYEIKN